MHAVCSWLPVHMSGLPNGIIKSPCSCPRQSRYPALCILLRLFLVSDHFIYSIIAALVQLFPRSFPRMSPQTHPWLVPHLGLVRLSFIFAAFGEVGGLHFMQNPILPSAGDDTWRIIIIYGVGAGEDQLARIDARSALSTMSDKSAHNIGGRTDNLFGWRFFFNGSRGRGWEIPVDDSYSGLAITRLGDELSGSTIDTRDHLDPGLIKEAGETIALFLMTLSSK